MDELKMTGNCLKGSRGILSFDAAFEETEWGRLTKELFTHVSVPSRRDSWSFSSLDVGTQTQIFGVPPQARRAKPFIDHVLTFSLLDSKIWFRNFQVRHDFFFETSKVFLLLETDSQQFFIFFGFNRADRRKGSFATAWPS
jgi:hypothetical protein